MIPIRESGPAKRAAPVTAFLFGVNIAVFLLAGPLLGGNLAAFAASPARILHCGQLGAAVDCSIASTLRLIATSMFLHVGVLHLAGNMLTLWLFGRNVEDRLGRAKFAILYLASGFAATFAYAALGSDPQAPIVGASGAIAATIGASMLLCPGARVTALTISFGGRREFRKLLNEAPAGAVKSRLVSIAATDLPAWAFGVIFLGFQFLQNTFGVLQGGTRIAYEAHVAGFITGLALVPLLAPGSIDPAVGRWLRGRRRIAEPRPASRTILSRTGESSGATRGWRALELFTDRADAIRIFAERINVDPAPSRILVVTGDGGTGKSLLLRYLMERCASRLPGEDWDAIRNLEPGRFAAELANGSAVPCATLDFGLPPRGDDRPQEAFSGLLMLRRQLAHPTRAFPVFDFACAHYLHETGGLSPERLRILFPEEERSFVASLADVLSEQHKVAESALDLIARRLGRSLDVYVKSRELDAATLTRIEELDPNAELLEELPALLARDLNAMMRGPAAPARVVLAFDTIEDLARVDAAGIGIGLDRDEWLRRLVGELDLEAGIVCVLIGRDAPRWDTSPRVKIPAGYFEVLALGNLTDEDAIDYLARAGVDAEAARLEITEAARVAPDQVHPLYLSLCADAALAAGTRAGSAELSVADAAHDAGTTLFERFLRQAGEETAFAVRALCAARSFTRGLYTDLGQEMGFVTSEPSFDALMRLGVVWRSGETFRINTLARRVAEQRGDEVTSRAHAALSRLYRRTAADGDVAAEAEALYHTSRLSPRRAAREWIARFGEAFDRNSLDRCRTLLQILPELDITEPDDQGLAARLAGDFLTRISRYAEGADSYRMSIAGYEQALLGTPDAIASLKGRGDGYRRLGETEAKLARYEAAITSYHEAEVSYTRALRVAPDDAGVLRGRANALRATGDAEVHLGHLAEALKAYDAAAATARKASRKDPRSVRTLNQLGVILRATADAQIFSGLTAKGAANLKRAMAALARAVELDPEDVEVLTNLGAARRAAADVLAGEGKTRRAKAGYMSALDAYDAVLRIAPEYAYAHNNRAVGLLRLEELDGASAGQRMKLLDDAQASCDRALAIAPAYVLALSNKGALLTRRGRWLQDAGDTTAARTAFDEAIAACEAAIARAPDLVDGLTNLAAALSALGDLDAGGGKEPRAQHTRAFEVLERALTLAPSDAGIRLMRDGLAKRTLGAASKRTLGAASKRTRNAATSRASRTSLPPARKRDQSSS